MMAENNIMETEAPTLVAAPASVAEPTSNSGCLDDPNFATICSFMEKFGETCRIGVFPFAELQEMIENTTEVALPLVQLHIRLLRRVFKSIATDKWERSLAKFGHTYCSQDGWEIERFGYKKAKIQTKLRLLKNLLESQFDYNIKFKAEVNKIPATDLRLIPMGRDTEGQLYWYQVDSDANLRVYREDVDDETWEIVASSREEMVQLISQLQRGEVKKPIVADDEVVAEEDSNEKEIEPKEILLDTGKIEEEPSEDDLDDEPDWQENDSLSIDEEAMEIDEDYIAPEQITVDTTVMCNSTIDNSDGFNNVSDSFSLKGAKIDISTKNNHDLEIREFESYKTVTTIGSEKEIFDKNDPKVEPLRLKKEKLSTEKVEKMIVPKERPAQDSSSEIQVNEIVLTSMESATYGKIEKSEVKTENVEVINNQVDSPIPEAPLFKKDDNIQNLKPEDVPVTKDEIKSSSPNKTSFEKETEQPLLLSSENSSSQGEINTEPISIKVSLNINPIPDISNTNALISPTSENPEEYSHAKLGSDDLSQVSTVKSTESDQATFEPLKSTEPIPVSVELSISISEAIPPSIILPGSDTNVPSEVVQNILPVAGKPPEKVEEKMEAKNTILEATVPTPTFTKDMSAGFVPDYKYNDHHSVYPTTTSYDRRELETSSKNIDPTPIELDIPKNVGNQNNQEFPQTISVSRPSLDLDEIDSDDDAMEIAEDVYPEDLSKDTNSSIEDLSICESSENGPSLTSEQTNNTPVPAISNTYYIPGEDSKGISPLNRLLDLSRDKAPRETISFEKIRPNLPFNYSNLHALPEENKDLLIKDVEDKKEESAGKYKQQDVPGKRGSMTELLSSPKADGVISKTSVVASSSTCSELVGDSSYAKFQHEMHMTKGDLLSSSDAVVTSAHSYLDSIPYKDILSTNTITPKEISTDSVTEMSVNPPSVNYSLKVNIPEKLSPANRGVTNKKIISPEVKVFTKEIPSSECKVVKKELSSHEVKTVSSGHLGIKEEVFEDDVNEPKQDESSVDEKSKETYAQYNAVSKEISSRNNQMEVSNISSPKKDSSVYTPQGSIDVLNIVSDTDITKPSFAKDVVRTAEDLEHVDSPKEVATTNIDIPKSDSDADYKGSPKKKSVEEIGIPKEIHLEKVPTPQDLPSENVQKVATFENVGKDSSENPLKDSSENVPKYSLESEPEDISLTNDPKDSSLECATEGISLKNELKDSSLDRLSENISSVNVTKDSLENGAKDSSLGNSAKDSSLGNSAKDSSLGNSAKDSSLENVDEVANSENIDFPKEVSENSIVKESLDNIDNSEQGHSENSDTTQKLSLENSGIGQGISTIFDPSMEASPSDAKLEKPQRPECLDVTKKVFPDKHVENDVSAPSISIPMEVPLDSIIENVNDISSTQDISKVFSENFDQKDTEDVDMEDLSSDVQVSVFTNVQNEVSNNIRHPYKESANKITPEVSSDSLDNQKKIPFVNVVAEIVPRQNVDLLSESKDNSNLTATENVSSAVPTVEYSHDVTSSDTIANIVPSPMGENDEISEEQSDTIKIQTSESVHSANIISEDVSVREINSDPSEDVTSKSSVEVDSSVSNSLTEEKSVSENTEEESADETTEEKSAVETTEEKSAAETAKEKLVVEIAEEKIVVGATDEASVNKSTEEKSVVEPTEEKSVAETAEEKSVVEPMDEKSVVGPMEEKSVKESTVEKSVAETTEEKSVVKPMEEKSANESTVEKSVVEPMEEKSANKSTVEKSVVELMEEKSVNESSVEKSVAETPEEKSVVELMEEKTVNESTVEKSVVEPMEEKSGNESTEEKSVVEPTEEKSANESTEEKSIVDPTEEKTANESTEEKSVVEPAEQTSVNESPVRKSLVESTDLSKESKDFESGQLTITATSSPKAPSFSTPTDFALKEESEKLRTEVTIDDKINPTCSPVPKVQESKPLPEIPTSDELKVESSKEITEKMDVTVDAQNEDKQMSANVQPETQTPEIPDRQTNSSISSVDKVESTKPDEVVPPKASLGGLVGYEYSSSEEDEPEDSGPKVQLVSSDATLKRKAESPLESVSKIAKIGETVPPVVPFNPIVGETIEEDVMTIEGLGSGAANEGGNNEQEVEANEVMMQEENDEPTQEVEVKKRGRGRPKKNPGTPGATSAPRGRPAGSAKRNNSDHSSNADTPVTPVTPRVRKRELENLSISFEGSSEMNGGDSINDRPVRASRRIAQIRQKEEEERRKLEEEKLAQLKAAQIRKQQKLLEKKKSELSDGEIAQPKIKKLTSKNKHKEYLPDPESESDSEEGDAEDGDDFELKPSKLKKRRRKRNKNGKGKKGGNPWVTSSSEDDEAVEEEEEYHYEEEEEDLVFNKSDHEFSPESDLGEEDDASPSRHARTAKRGEEIVDKYAETYCDKCGKGDHPEWILLCDMCDKGWHASCIRPQLWVIPEGQWFCPPCQHNTLIEKLNENLIEYEKILKRRENELLRKQRLAYVGISLDNVLPGGAPVLDKEDKEYFIEKSEKEERQERYNQRERKNRRRRRIDSDDDDEDLEGDDFINDDDSDKASHFNSSGEESDEPIYKLRARRATKSFNFKEYDEMINSALRVDDDGEMDALETVEAENKPEASNGKGKSMGDDEESEEQESDPGINVGENGVSKVRKRILMSAKRTSSDEPAGKKMLDEDTDEEELDEKEKNRLKELMKHSSQRKTKRRLNDLDAPSDEDEDSDEDFQGSGGDDDDEDEEEAIEDDSEWSGDREADESDDSIQRGARNKKQGRLGRREKYLEVGSVRRSTRRRKARISYDESDEEGEEDGSDKWQSDESDESESNSESEDETWGKKKKRKTFNPPKAKFIGNPFQMKPKPKKKKRKADDDDVDRAWSSNAKKKSADEPVERRTRGRKINFKDILDSGESDDDGNIRPKRRRILSDSDSDSDAPTSSRKLIEEIKAQNAREAAMHAAKSILSDEKHQLEEKQAAAAASAVVLPEPKVKTPPPMSVSSLKAPSLVPPPLQSDSSAASSKGRSRSSSPSEKAVQLEMEMAMSKPVPAPPFPPSLAKALGRKSTPSPATLAAFASTIDNNLNLLPPLGQPLPAHPPVSLSSSPTHPLQLSHSPSNSPSSLSLSLPLTVPPSQTPPPPSRGSKKNSSLNVPTPPKGSLSLPPAALTPPKPPISPQQTLPPGMRANLPSDIARLGNPAALYPSNAPLRPFHPAWRSSVPPQYGNPGAGMPNTSIGKPPPLSGPPFSMSQQGPPRSGYPSPPPLRIPNPGNSPLQAFQQFKRDALPPGMPMYRMPPSTQQGGPIPGILPPNMAALNQGPPDRYFGGPPGSYGHPPYGLPPPHNQSQPPSIFPPFDYRIQHLQRPSEPFKDEPPPAQSQPPANEPPSSPPPASAVINATKEEPPGSQGDGEFGGLVSYFSSQRSNEEDLDT